jgi:hypothetical protein
MKTSVITKFHNIEDGVSNDFHESMNPNLSIHQAYNLMTMVVSESEKIGKSHQDDAYYRIAERLNKEGKILVN